MAVKLRLQRYGSKRRPHYRIIAADHRAPRDGRFIEILGTYNPVTKPAEVKFDEGKVMNYLRDGAQPTDTVRSLFSKQGIMEKFHNERQGK